MKTSTERHNHSLHSFTIIWNKCEECHINYDDPPGVASQFSMVRVKNPESPFRTVTPVVKVRHDHRTRGHERPSAGGKFCSFDRTIPNLTSSFAATIITAASRGRHLTRNVNRDKMISLLNCTCHWITSLLVLVFSRVFIKKNKE